MIRITTLTLAGLLAAPFAVAPTFAFAEPAAATTATTPTAPTKVAAMSDADKRAKAADCSKQANEKGLHGSAREKFRAACKRK